MLNMKHTWKAVMTLGLALLLGPGVVMAQENTYRLDGLAPPTALKFASETLPLADAMGLRALELENVVDIAVLPRRAIAADEEVYLRIDLAGARFGAAPTIVGGAASAALGGTVTGTPSSGGAGASFAVFELGAYARATDPTDPVLVGVQIPDNGAGADLMLTSSSGNVTATITAYSNPDDALDEEGVRSTFGGSAAIIRLVSGLTVTIKAADDAVPNVDTGFIRFLEGGANVGTARLGWLGVEENIVEEAMVRTATDGSTLDRGDILTLTNPDDATSAPIGMISFNVMGNLDIGAFTTQAETFDAETPPNPTGTCAGGMADQVDQGNLLDAQGMPLISEEGDLPSGVESATTGAEAPDVYLLCLNVDVTGPMSNMMAIPDGDYSATAYMDRDGNPSTPAQMVGEGSLASLDRNGASVELPYLTTSEKHNQRLIIVNRGPRPAGITSIQVHLGRRH